MTQPHDLPQNPRHAGKELQLSQSTLRSTLPYYAIAAQAPHLMGDYHRLVADAAYFRAERRGFVPGHEAEDWLAAEAEIALRLNEGR
jgi:hypothetical protein